MPEDLASDWRGILRPKSCDFASESLPLSIPCVGARSSRGQKQPSDASDLRYPANRGDPDSGRETGNQERRVPCARRVPRLCRAGAPAPSESTCPCRLSTPTATTFCLFLLHAYVPWLRPCRHCLSLSSQALDACDSALAFCRDVDVKR